MSATHEEDRSTHVKPQSTLGRHAGVLIRALSSAPGWPTGVLTGLVFALSCWSISVPGSYFGWVLICQSLWLLLGLIWLIRLIAAVATARRKIRWRYYLVQPVFVVILTVFVSVDAPLWTRYLLSRGAMNDQAGAVLAGKEAQTIHRIGLFRVNWVERQGRVFRFTVDGAGFIDSVGFAYIPEDPPRDDSEYEHWSGPWYIWTKRF